MIVDIIIAHVVVFEGRLSSSRLREALKEVDIH